MESSLSYQGFIYSISVHRKLRDYWRCIRKKCFAYAITEKKDEKLIVIKTGEHNHSPSDDAMDVD